MEGQEFGGREARWQRGDVNTGCFNLLRVFEHTVLCWQIAASLLIELADNTPGLLSIACMGGRLRECKYIITSQMPLCCLWRAKFYRVSAQKGLFCVSAAFGTRRGASD